MALECMYDGCGEEFEDHNSRLIHSMEEHHNINSRKYRHITGQGARF